MDETRKPAASSTRIHQVIAPWASGFPDTIALQDEHCRLTYSELASVIEDAKDRLLMLEVRPGDRVLLVGENCVALGVLVFAVTALDGLAVVVNARLSEQEIDNLIEHAGARRVFYTCDISAQAHTHAQRHRAVVQSWPIIGSLGISPINASAVAEATSEDPEVQVAAMIYTSETSGNPKAVMLTHANLLHIACVLQELRGPGPQDTVYGVLPISHVVGLSSLLVGSLACGSSVVLAARYTPEGLVRALLDDGLTILIGVPAMFAKLLEWCRETGMDISGHQLRIAGVAGSSLTPELKCEVQQALGIVLQNNYAVPGSMPTPSHGTIARRAYRQNTQERAEGSRGAGQRTRLTTTSG